MADRTPDYFSPLTGWRIWRLYPDGQLRGINHQLWYGGRPNVAYCTNGQGTRHPDHSPSLRCTCGLWSFKNLPLLINSGVAGHVGNVLNAGDHRCHILGTIKIWGRVIEHTLGFRSEYAYPKGIILSPGLKDHRELKRLIQDRYHCEVQISDIVEKYRQLEQERTRWT